MTILFIAIAIYVLFFGLGFSLFRAKDPKRGLRSTFQAKPVESVYWPTELDLPLEDDHGSFVRHLTLQNEPGDVTKRRNSRHIE